METISLLRAEIEEKRNELNQAIAEGQSSENVYKHSVALDTLIERYLDVVEQE